MARFTARYAKHARGKQPNLQLKAYAFLPCKISTFLPLQTACKRRILPASAKTQNGAAKAARMYSKNALVPTATTYSRSKRTQLVRTIGHPPCHVVCTVGNPASAVGITTGYHLTGGAAIGGAWFYSNYATPGYTVVTATTAGLGNAGTFLQAYRLAWRAAKRGV